MRCRRKPVALTSALFIFGFACTLAFVAYTHLLSLPGRLSLSSLQENHVEINNSSVAIGKLLASLTDANQKRSVARTKTSTTGHAEREYTLNGISLPLIDFKDLGRYKTKVLLLVIVSTAPQRFDRRHAIRATWWKHCAGKQVKCVFMTDGFIEDHVQRNLTMQERDKYKDVKLQPNLGGREFGLRFLNQIKWAIAKFNFRYLLRIDDDYFLCLKRLLSELPTRPKKNLVWGHFHCEVGITWVDEGLMIFTRDIIQKFLAQNESTMLCHAIGDQQIGLWLNNIPNKIFFHDTRLHHDPPASYIPQFDNITNVCDSYLGVHGTYATKMLYLGLNANDGGKDVQPVADFSSFCQFTRFDYRVMNVEWRYDPKPCKDNPTWNERKMFVGREKH